MYAKEVMPGVYLIDNFINKDTCDFIINSMSSKIVLDNDQKGVYGALGTKDKNPYSFKGEYSKNEKYYNVSLDLINNIFFAMKDLASNIYGQEHILKQTFYSCMTSGGKNPQHIDNYNDEYSEDKSAILYLNDTYYGGELYFNKQDVKLKLNPGSLLIFKGDETRPHEVLEVQGGKRYNLITFFEPKNDVSYSVLKGDN